MRTIKTLLLPVAATVCLTVSAFAQNATPAAPAQNQTQNTATAAKGKTIKFTVVNTTNGPIAIRTGDQEMTLAAGQSRAVKAPAGTKIVTTADSSVGQSGTVIAEVSDGMSGATVNVR
jgi:hypothetical protein